MKVKTGDRLRLKVTHKWYLSDNITAEVFLVGTEFDVVCDGGGVWLTSASEGKKLGCFIEIEDEYWEKVDTKLNVKVGDRVTFKYGKTEGCGTIVQLPQDNCSYLLEVEKDGPIGWSGEHK